MTKENTVDLEMTHRALAVGPKEDLYHAFSLMRRAGIRHLLVMDGGELVGMLSDRDILKHGRMKGSELVVGNGPVSEAMTRGVRTTSKGARLADVADEMLRYHVDALPVIDAHGKVLGIITSADLLHHVRRVDGVLDVGAMTEGQIQRQEW